MFDFDVLDERTYVRENCDRSGVFCPSALYYLDSGNLYLEQAEWFHVGPCEDPEIKSLLCNPNMELICFNEIVAKAVELDDYDGEWTEDDYECEQINFIDSDCLAGEMIDKIFGKPIHVEFIGYEDKLIKPADEGHINVVFWGDRWVIEDCTFLDCRNLRSVKLPEIVLGIGEEAFAGCVNLAELVIPDTVNYIGKDAFLGVQHITYHGSLKSENNWGALSMN